VRGVDAGGQWIVRFAGGDLGAKVEMRKMVPRKGFEPPTHALRIFCPIPSKPRQVAPEVLLKPQIFKVNPSIVIVVY
jgi:hypothetical protein